MANKKKVSPKKKKIDVHIDKAIESVIPKFLEHKRKDCLDMRAAFDSNDYDSVRVNGHKIRGSGGSYGFAKMSEIGEQIELAVIKLQESVEQINSGIEELSEYLDKVNVIYDG